MLIASKKIEYYVSGNDRVIEEEVSVVEFFITFGGGMGGGNYTIYGTIKAQFNDKYVVCDAVTGEEITIFKNFIVTMKTKKVIKIRYDKTYGCVIVIDKNNTIELLENYKYIKEDDENKKVIFNGLIEPLGQ